MAARPECGSTHLQFSPDPEDGNGIGDLLVWITA
jgi:hypothetical protein